MSEEYKTNVEMLIEIKDKAYQSGRAYERKRILEIAKSMVIFEKDQTFVRDLEEAAKEPHKE